MAETELNRLELLVGKENLKKIQNSCVLIVGIGGVGSWAAEALARSGIGKLILMDMDTVALSNLNRQVMALYDTVGMDKTEAMRSRIQSYNRKTEVECIQKFFDLSCADIISRADFVIDAIDTVTSKIDLMQACIEADVPFVSSLGMGNRLDPSMVHLCTLQETSGDPLARSVRAMARKRGITQPVTVLFSSEKPAVQNTLVNPDGETRKQRIPPASSIFVPAEAGLLAASAALRTLIGESIL